MINKLKQFCNRIGISTKLGVAIVILVAVYILLTFIPAVMWGHIKDGLEYLSTEWPRNVIIGIGALIGLWIAYQRSDAMQKQAKAANEQVKTANEQAKVANEQAKIANQQSDLAEKRYASEQFSQSATLLAKDNQNGTPVIEARVGGIYMLATLAESDPRQYGAEVMTALVIYICNNAQRTAVPVPSKKNKGELTIKSEERSEPAHLGADVKAAFAKLKRLHSNSDVRENSGVKDEDLSFSHADFRTLRLDEIEWIEKPDLSHANLQDANLWQANLQDANLWQAKLQGADLWQANLQDAYLYESYLKDAGLAKAELQGANLWWADLTDARLQSADLQGARLQSADLQDARLQSADLSGANLRYAKLQGADFTNAKVIYTSFERAKFNSLTTIPAETVKEWKIWHDDNEFLLDRGIQPLEPDAEWDLDLIFPEKDVGFALASEVVFALASDVRFALEGILRNFAERGDNKPNSRAIECRKAVKQWVIDNRFLEHLSGDWKGWLKSLDSNGYASDDK